MAAVCKGDKLLSALAGLLHYEIAAEIASERADVKGPGTFVPALIDELYNLQKATSEGNVKWLEKAKVEAHMAEKMSELTGGLLESRHAGSSPTHTACRAGHLDR